MAFTALLLMDTEGRKRETHKKRRCSNTFLETHARCVQVTFTAVLQNAFSFSCLKAPPTMEKWNYGILISL
jgi:hypothetical protein